MTRAKTKTTAKAEPDPADPKTVALTCGPNDDPAEALAKAMLGPNVRHGAAAMAFVSPMMGNKGETLTMAGCIAAVESRATEASKGDLAFASAMLASQAVTLDTMFTELAGRAARNMGEYIGATDTYARLAMKAQAQSRATLETLTKLHQPREQTVRHVHVNEGGQAVIADQFHHHNGGIENGQSGDQPHATGSAGASPALPCSDPLRDTVPSASGKGEAPVPVARGPVAGCAEG